MNDSITLAIVGYGLLFWIAVWFGELIYNGCKWWRRRQLKGRERCSRH